MNRATRDFGVHGWMRVAIASPHPRAWQEFAHSIHMHVAWSISRRAHLAEEHTGPARAL